MWIESSSCAGQRFVLRLLGPYSKLFWLIFEIMSMKELMIKFMPSSIITIPKLNVGTSRSSISGTTFYIQLNRLPKTIERNLYNISYDSTKLCLIVIKEVVHRWIMHNKTSSDWSWQSDDELIVLLQRKKLHLAKSIISPVVFEVRVDWSIYMICL